VHFFATHRTRGYRAPGIPAPFDLERAGIKEYLAQKSMRRDREVMSQRRCEELLRRSNLLFLSFCCAMDCFAALAMTTSLVITRESG
jgi:hypothetical protein